MYSKTKRVFCVALFVVLCMTIICGSAATSREPSEPLPPLETIMSIDVKTSTPFTETTATDNLSRDDSIACFYDEGGDGHYYGPTDYAIMDSDRFCVLDAESDYIRVFSIAKGTLINSIDISYCDRPLSVCYGDGIFYVYDPDWDRVVSYSEDGTMLADIPVPGAGDESDYSSLDEYCSKDIAIFGARLTNHNGEIMLVLGKNAKNNFNDYKLVNNSFVECEPLYTVYTDTSERDSIYPGCDVTEWSEMTTVTCGDHSWTFDSFGIGMDVLGVDKDNNLYLFCSVDFVSVKGKILDGTSVRVYDANSNLVSGVDLDCSDFRVMPIKRAKLGVNNELFIFAGTKEEMRLMKVNTQKGYTMDTTLIEEALEEYRMAHNEETRVGGLTPTRTRSEAYNVAKPYVDYSYTVTPKNAHAWSGCVLHEDIAGITSNKKMTGVPYARGEMQTISKINTLKTTVYGTYNGSSYYYCAGNVNKAWAKGAFGVDCAGYASRAYGFGAYYNTTKLSKEFYDSSWSSPKKMDSIVRADYHVMLLVEKNGSDYTVYEASRKSGKVLCNVWSKAILTGEGYDIKNPWHSGSCPLTVKYNSTQHWNACSRNCGYVGTKTNHSFLTKYSSNTTHHWKACAGCNYKGSYAQHTWIASGTGYICSVCKRTSPTNPGLTALPQYVTGIKQDIS